MTRRALGAGLGFGGLAFLAGAVLGPLRELLLAPRLGGLAAAWIEAAAMALLLLLAARVTLAEGLGPIGRAVESALALAAVVAAEAVLGWLLAVTGLAAQRAPRGVVEQLPGLLLLCWLVLLPFLIRRG